MNIDPHKSGLPSKLNTGLAEGSDSIISDWMYGYNTEKIVKYRYPASKYSFPATTSSEVGWPWGRGKEYGAEENIGSDGKGPGHRPAKSRYSPKYYTLETYKINTRGVDASLKFFGGPEAMP